MAVPLVRNVSPSDAETDVTLGAQIVVTFDQKIDVTTVTESTFSLTGPGQTQIFTPDQMSAAEPETLTGREYISGVFSFEENADDCTVVRFNPSKPLRKDAEYTVLILGASSALSSDAVKNLEGVAMVSTYEWSFKTGHLNVVVPPLAAPLPEMVSYIDPKEIVVIPRQVIGNNLAQEIQLIFPDEIDASSVDLTSLLVAIEPILGDLSVQVPEGLVSTARIDGRKILITITGW